MKTTAKKLLSIFCAVALLLSCFAGIGANAAGLPAATDSDLECYYVANSFYGGNGAKGSVGSYYAYDKAANSFTRTNGTDNNSWGVATLYDKNQYEDFILEFDLKFHSYDFDDAGKRIGPESVAYVVFGDKELGDPISPDILTDGTESIHLINTYSADTYTGLLMRRFQSGGSQKDWWQNNKVTNMNPDAYHHVKVTVIDGKLNLYFGSVRMINNWDVNTNYTGGYVGIGTSCSDVAFSNINISYYEPAEMFKDFTPYHASNTGFYLQNATKSDYSAWTYKGNGIAGCTNNPSGTAILYSNEKYNNFEITFDYTTTNSTFYLGFGAQEMGGNILTKGNLDNPSPSMIQFCDTGVCAFAPNAAGNDGWFGNNAGNLFTDADSKAAVHTAKVTVMNKVATVWINGKSQGSITLQNYAGGHIFFAGRFANDAFSTPVITTPEMANDVFSEDWVAYESTTNYSKQFWQENLSAKENISDSFYLNTANRLTPYNGSTISFIYSKEKYTDFEMDFEFTSGNNVYLGIGASDLGVVPTKPIAEHSAFSMKLYNSGVLQAAPTNAAGSDGWPYNDSWRTADDTQNANSVHTCKVVVSGGKVALYIDGHRLGGASHSYAAPNYKGGHVYIQITDNGESVSLPTIKDINVNNMLKDYTSFEATSNYNGQFWPAGLTKQDDKTANLNYAIDGRFGAINGSTQTVLYSNAKYTNFDMSFEFTSNNNLYVGIGAPELGAVPTKPISEHSPFVMKLYNSGVIQAAPANAAGGDGWPFNESWRTPADTQNANSVHNCRIVVDNGKVALYIDGHRLISNSFAYSPLNYKGGHIFFILTDANETITVPNIISNDPEPEINGVSISAGTDIAVKYYSYYGEGYTMKFTVNNKETIAEGCYDAAKGMYVYQYDVTPERLGNKINAELMLGEEVIDVKEDFSVVDYLKAFDGKTADELNISEAKLAALKVLANDMLHYGAAAQKYFGYKTDELVNADAGEGTVFVAPTTTDKDVTNKEVNGVKITGQNLYFDSVNRLMFKFTVDPEVIDETANVQFKITDGIDTTVIEAADFEKIGENEYVVYGDDIYATEFDTVFTATVVVNGEDTANVKYSVNSYVYAMCNKADLSEDMLNLAKATYNYGLAAEAYAAE